MECFNGAMTRRYDKVCMYEEMMMNNDNVESNIPTKMATMECFNGAMTILVHVTILVNLSTTLVPKLVM